MVGQQLKQTVDAQAQAIKARDEAQRQFAESQKQLAAQKQKVEALEKEVASLRAQLATPQENKAQAEALASAQNRLKDAEQENELLLLQLHQVQEELEHYFLQHQDIQKQLKAADERWQRMLQRSPGYCDYAALDLLDMDASGKGSWRLSGLHAAGRSIPELQFGTVVEQGVAGLVLTKPETGSTPLLHWPTSADGNELTLIPLGNGPQLAQRLNCFIELATSDWDLLKVLLTVLRRELSQPATLQTTAPIPRELLRAGLDTFSQVLERFPAVLRFDRVTLKREQVNPDYEHLWLHFDNLAFGAERWATFAFRLSCANVAPGHFGNYPKLEFPEDGAKLAFDSWFNEAHDDFGSKLELRFALPDAMDLAVWGKLSAHDQAFIAALTARLPAVLAMLQSEATQLQRAWSDWDNMARNVQRIVAANKTPAVKPAETKAVSSAPVVEMRQAKAAEKSSKPSVAKTSKSKAKVLTTKRIGKQKPDSSGKKRKGRLVAQ